LEVNVKVKVKRIISLSLATGVILLISTTFLKTGKAERYSEFTTPDLSIHPTYSNYKFNKAENIVNLGVSSLFIRQRALSPRL
jgi:hypothetical protein